MRPISAVLFAITLVGAVGCQNTPKETPTDDATKPGAATNTGATGAATNSDAPKADAPKADAPKADAPKAGAKPVTLAIKNPEPMSLCAEFDPNATPRALPDMPKDTDTPKMLVKFASRDAIARGLGITCTAPSTDAFDFDKNHVVYLRTKACNDYASFETFELGKETLTLVAKNNRNEVLCMNLGHAWFGVPAIDRDVVIRGVD